MKKKLKKGKLTPFLISVVVLSLLEVTLVFANVIPLVFYYSLGNLIIMLIVLAVILYAGVSYAEEGLGRAALAGASLGFAVSSVVCIAAIISSQYLEKPILGVSADSRTSLFLTLVLIIALTSILDAFVATLAAFLTIKYRK